MSKFGQFCYAIDPTSPAEEEGYVPYMVFAGNPRWYRLDSAFTGACTWHWGTTLRAADDRCSIENAKRGLSCDEVDAIILSSLRAREPGTVIPTTAAVAV